MYQGPHKREDHLRKENRDSKPVMDIYVKKQWDLLVLLWGIKRDACNCYAKHNAYRNLLKIWGRCP